MRFKIITVSTKYSVLAVQNVRSLVHAEKSEEILVVCQSIDQDRQAVPFVAATLPMKVERLVADRGIIDLPDVLREALLELALRPMMIDQIDDHLNCDRENRFSKCIFWLKTFLNEILKFHSKVSLKKD